MNTVTNSRQDRRSWLCLFDQNVADHIHTASVVKGDFTFSCKELAISAVLPRSRCFRLTGEIRTHVTNDCRQRLGAHGRFDQPGDDRRARR